MVDKAKSGEVTKSSKEKDKMHQSKARPEVSGLISERLRSFYDGVSKQPIPDRFIELLQQLESASPPKKEN
jgi:Anti-sigma factor NepR